MSLSGRVCLVTGGTRGIGKGIALQLGEAGATVYVTGRTLKPRPGDAVGGSLEETAEEIKARGGVGIPVVCDHQKDEDVEALFERIATEQNGRLDMLVNNAYAAVKAIGDHQGTPFWEQPLWMWDVVNNVGLRNHYICTCHGARLMTKQKSGLIVNVSSYGGLKYIFNCPYGIGKEALDRMAGDCGTELRRHNVAMISLWPGAVQTEEVMTKIASGKGLGASPEMAQRFKEGETTEFPGMCIVSLARDDGVMAKTGKVLLTCDLAEEYDLYDLNGSKPKNIRSVREIIRAPWAKMPAFAKMVAWCIPSFIKIPRWMLYLAGNKF